MRETITNCEKTPWKNTQHTNYNTSNTMHTTIAIIGAGASGLSAAHHLLLQQHTNRSSSNSSSDVPTVKNIILLEASDVVGGRIQSDYNFLTNHIVTSQPLDNNATTCRVRMGIELGAEFIHGGNGSVLYALVQQQGWAVSTAVRI